MINSFIKNNEQVLAVKKIRKVLQVRSGSYYRSKQQISTARLRGKIAIKEKITLIFFEFKQRYGNPRLTLELRSIGYKILKPENFARTGKAISVAKYMKQLGLRSKLSKKFKVTTNSNYYYLIVENILNRGFIVKMPPKAWVWNIT